MDFGYAIQILREKLVDDSYELTLAVEQKDEEVQERQKERLAILQDAMNALAKPSSIPQANELLPHVSGSNNFKKILKKANSEIWHLTNDEIRSWEKDGSIERGDILYKVVTDTLY